MAKKLAFIHTMGTLVSTFRDLAKQVLPEIEIVHLVDETLLKEILAAGIPTPRIRRQVMHLVSSAEEWGAELVVVTCSSVSQVVDQVQPFVGVRVMKIDEAMADCAVQWGKTIGVMATATTTLGPTSNLVLSRASLAQKQVEVRSILCEGAYPALMAGDLQTHDDIIRSYLKKLMPFVDVVVLAQASMAHAVEDLPESERKVPVLSSPRLGLERAKEILGAL